MSPDFRIVCLWYGDLGETGQAWAFDPYVQEFKKLGFDVDTFYDRDSQSVLNAIELRSNERSLQGLFVVGHGSPDGFGTGGGWFDYNPLSEWIKYKDVGARLSYLLGTVIPWVCYGDNYNSQILTSLTGEFVFNGVSGTLIPFEDYTSILKLFANGKQGTKVP